MNFHHLASTEEAQGRATFGEANLRKEKTGLPFIVFISQKDATQHDVRVKVSPAPKARTDQMSSYALRPFRLVAGPGMSASETALLQRWAGQNLDVLIGYWDGDIEYTEDAVARLTLLSE